MTESLRDVIRQQALSFESLGFRVYFSFKYDENNRLRAFVVLEDGLHLRYNFNDPDLNIIVKQLSQLYLTRKPSKMPELANEENIEEKRNICLTCHQELPLNTQKLA